MKTEPEPYSGNDLSSWWKWVGDYLDWLSLDVPCGEEPDIMGESSRKERLERWEVEQELLEETKAFLERFLSDWDWQPECACKHTLFFVEERIKWAVSFCHFLSRLPDSHGVSGLDAVNASAAEIWKWLTIDCYDSSDGIAKKWHQCSSADEWY